MTTYFITRHPGARAWAEARRVRIDLCRAHLEIDTVHPGDTVIGTLPVHLAAAVCERGARYLHLSLEIPSERRGSELNAEDMARFGARLEEYRVERLGGDSQ